MQVLGIDFTSSPKSKPITCLTCCFDGSKLKAGNLEMWNNFSLFDEALSRPGPWIAGIDFPFGQSRKFIENVGWPKSWEAYVRHIEEWDQHRFETELTNYRKPRQSGDKEHLRKTDAIAGAKSPQKLYGVPVAKMFFKGAPRLLKSGATIAHLKEGDPERVVVEAYPGVLVRQMGIAAYKHDSKNEQTSSQMSARQELLRRFTAQETFQRLGFCVEAADSLCDDPKGDQIDALICAIQATWAWSNRFQNYGAPNDVDPLEGWISTPPLV